MTDWARPKCDFSTVDTSADGCQPCKQITYPSRMHWHNDAVIPDSGRRIHGRRLLFQSCFCLVSKLSEILTVSVCATGKLRLYKARMQSKNATKILKVQVAYISNRMEGLEKALNPIAQTKTSESVKLYPGQTQFGTSTSQDSRQTFSFEGILRKNEEFST